MKHIPSNREDPVLADVTAELSPAPDPPSEHYTQRFIMRIGGKRYELTTRVEMREIAKGPAKVIEMPGRPAV
jgi:hypothetical protein